MSDDLLHLHRETIRELQAERDTWHDTAGALDVTLTEAKRLLIALHEDEGVIRGADTVVYEQVSTFLWRNR